MSFSLRMLMFSGFSLLVPSALRAEEKVDFVRDIRPILSNRCFKCHGPAVAKSGLRLDTRVGSAKKDAVVPGKAAQSGLIERVTSTGEDERMPPPESGDRLTPDQVKKLRAWIEQGAEYAPHWSYVKPVRPALPSLPKSTAVIRNPIDSFIVAKLTVAGLTPSAPADKATLIRRVTLDLTGLLPTPKDVEEFLADKSADAYEKVVDRLLASPHYGERMARHWLDLARYADSNGYTVDGPRSIWPYRDWVIKAFNDDMPFDRFTIEQLAGDLLPNPSKNNLTATGFHRNTSYNEEGGTDREQFRVERTIDRASTTGAVWLGLTVGCAQCHDHKFDQFSQKDYYRLYAFFNSCQEPTLTIGGTPELEKKINDMQEQANQLNQAGKLEEAKKVTAAIKKLSGQIPTTLIVREMKAPRPTFVQIRGDFLRPGDPVVPGYPAAISATTESVSADKPKQLTRLDLAKWLVSSDNPLTARVVANREWQKFFGRGLVETENDFGAQGSLPTHPELLDWLAMEFMQPKSGTAWSFKHLHRTIVTSATYRQASVARADLTAKDPRNLLLGRQSRLRMEAEIIRDAALCASGLYNPKIGGPGVYPPQPKEVFSFTQSSRNWVESKGPERYRRGMYTYIWRQSQHPLLTTFDGADAQTACTRRNRSNTPLQALHLANDPVFVELAEGFAKRIETEGPSDDPGRIARAFQIAFTRLPSPDEAARLQAYLETQRKEDPKTAWRAVARVLMNLDEFVTRE